MYIIIIRTDAQSNRKALVGALSELFHEKPRYCGAPTFAYEFGVGQLARDASLHLVPSLNETAAERLAATLAERGFSCTVETVSSEIETEDNAHGEVTQEESSLPDDRFTVTIPADRLSPDALARLRNLIASRRRLFCDALNAAELPVLEKGDQIAFPWFKQTDDEEERAAYALFIERLAELSNRLKWAASTEKDAPNEKYAMRCFLLRLGFIGAEYKRARAVLLRNLQGSSAFRNGGKPSQAETNAHEENHPKDLPAGRRDRYHALCEAALRRGTLPPDD